MKRAPNSTVTLGLVQAACAPSPAANLKRTLAAVTRAAQAGAQIICTQELFRSQYFCQSEDHAHFALAEPIPGPSTTAFQKLARQHRVVIIASLFERRAAGLYHNTAAIIDADGSLLGCYRKMHIPDDPLFYEKFYFTPGDLGFRAWQTRYRADRCVDLLGPMVSRSGAPHRDARAPTSSSIPRPSAGIPARRRSTASASMPPGRPSSAATPWPTAAMSPRSTVSGMKSWPVSAAMVWSSGAGASSRHRGRNPRPSRRG
jgi:hypothetical protein